MRDTKGNGAGPRQGAEGGRPSNPYRLVNGQVDVHVPIDPFEVWIGDTGLGRGRTASRPMNSENADSPRPEFCQELAC